MEGLKAIIERDDYLKPRRNPTEAELRLYLREVDFYCPLCGKELQSRKQKKPSEKRFQIAHIYPNSPTSEQYQVLLGLERLGEDCESFENKIALCKDCHGTQDFRTTPDEYLKLMEIKKAFLTRTALHDATSTLGLEKEIEQVISSIYKLKDTEIAELIYEAVPIANKFVVEELILKSKISGYIFTYYIYIRDLFNKLDGTNGFNFEILSGQIRACFIKMDSTGANKSQIFSQIVDWIKNQTQSKSIEACEAVVSFFVQNCEVFYEIPK